MKFPHLVLVILAGISPWILQVQGAVPQTPSADIAKADDLYYQGRYAEALSLLTQLDDSLTAKAGSAEDQSKVKMLLGLTQVALGNSDQAHTRFLQFCALNPTYVLDELQYPRKVITAFKEAQQDCTKCVQICARVESLVAAGNLKEVADTKADSEFCACASRAFVRDEPALRRGKELLTQEKYPEALQEFQTALAAVPESALRREAVQTAQARIDSSVGSVIAEWREAYLSRDFARAATTYDRIRTLGVKATGTVRDQVSQITARYQSTFQDLAKSWDAACASNDQVALNSIREWGKSLDPNRTIQPAALDRMVACTKSAAPKTNNGK